MESAATVPHLVSVGGGFAGLWATRALASAPLRISLLDRSNHHPFQPLLYQVATARLSAPDIAALLRHVLRRRRNVTVLMQEAVAVEATEERLRCTDGGAIGYDYLLLASGARHAYCGHDARAENAPGLKTLDDAFAIRRHLLLAFERAKVENDPQRRRALFAIATTETSPPSAAWPPSSISAACA
jgi:NADH dehydrogenase